ncbi:MAG: hypothetical protein ACRDAM_18760 [Casimicrobium sp.]
MPPTAKGHEVSPNNPCPFLRALVSAGMLPDDVASLGEVTDVITRVAKTGDGHPNLPGAAIRAIAAAANGLNPLQVVRNVKGGVRLNELRNGPLDKKGAGSGILDADANVVKAELARLDEFASEKVSASGETERGLDLKALVHMMNENFKRAEGRRRVIDRFLMDGEWPILLKVMGKSGKDGRYLSVQEVRQLFVERKLPERMMSQLGA